MRRWRDLVLAVALFPVTLGLMLAWTVTLWRDQSRSLRAWHRATRDRSKWNG